MNLAHGQLGALRSEDILCVLSLSGETEELFKPLETCKQRGLKLLLVTANANSRLGKLADDCYELHIAKSVDPDGGIAVLSSLVFSIFISAICLEVSGRIKINPRQLLLNHPSGDIAMKIRTHQKSQPRSPAGGGKW